MQFPIAFGRKGSLQRTLLYGIVLFWCLAGGVTTAAMPVCWHFDPREQLPDSLRRTASSDSLRLRQAADSATLLPAAQVSAQGKKGAAASKQFSVGTHITRFSPEALQNFKDVSLASYLQRNSAVYIKEFGQGMGAYISIRGTSASHTSVQWNGMSMELPTMGQTDFSHLPLFFFDAMDLHIGGGSTLYGNGSIGGSVQMATQPRWQPGLHGQIKLTAGSFGQLFSGANLRYHSGNWESRTALFYHGAKNNFYFTNNTEPGKPRQQQQHAAYTNAGLLQELYRRWGDGQQLSLHLWHTRYARDVQPSVSNNLRPESYTELYDRNSKVSVAYKGQVQHLKISADLGYAYDYERYEQDLIAAHRLVGAVEASYSHRAWTWKAGGKILSLHPTGAAFETATKESRVDVFGLTLWKISPRLSLNAGLRQTWVSKLSLSPDPFIGGQYQFLGDARHRHSLSLRAAFSRSHKIPSLNDRYWGGMHTYLRPEQSRTWEAGADYEGRREAWHWELHTTLYSSQVHDWIRWLPAGVVWRPQNIPEVHSSGIEASWSVEGKLSSVNIGLHGSYSYTAVSMQEGLWPQDPGKGRQLAYQPYHCGVLGLQAGWRRYSLDLQSRYTGTRTTTDLHDKLPAYPLLNLRAGYRLPWGTRSIDIHGLINNLTQTDYQNVKFYAMPGRSWQLSMQLIF
jgi:Outer membrane cobalamin receptor protein